MSRRDTIIVAVLINAGLLIVLFASALKSNSSDDDFVTAPPSHIQESSDLAAKKGPISLPADEVDVALKQFTQDRTEQVSSNAHVQASVQPQSLPPISSPAPPSPNFTEDLKAIATVEAPSVQSIQKTASQTLMAPLVPNRPDSEFIEIKVKKGDVLEKIARQHHTTVTEIMKVNKLTSSNLRIGQVLKIPNKAIKKAEPSTVVFSPQTSLPNTEAANENGAKYYIVKKGDNPWTIAVKNHLKVEDLLKLNNMTEEQARRLKPGDQLRIQ